MKFAYYYRNKDTGDVKRYVFDIDDVEYLDRYFDDLGMAFSSFMDFDKYMINEGYELLKRSRNTGVKDTEGSPIFEDDIVDMEIAGEMYRVQVVWDEKRAAFSGKDNNGWEIDDVYENFCFNEADSMKVIGNIYQHPTLFVNED